MLVLRIKEFISALSEVDNLKDYDLEFLSAFKEKFQDAPKYNEILLKEYDLQTDNAFIVKDFDNSRLDDEALLDEKDFEWLLAAYHKRSGCVEDSPEHDYTFYPEGDNTPWVLLAQDLGAELNIPWVLILMPTLVNQLEPTKLWPLTNITDTRKIFRSNENIWHRTLALYEEINKNSACCGIIDDPKENKLRALTIEECYRIRSKRGDKLEVRCDGETYKSFWDFILKKSAIHWQKYGNYPAQMLPDLLQLIGQYYKAKAGNNTFGEFHRNFNTFSKNLASCALENINHLYSIKIQVEEQSYFLVEILVDCFENREDLSEKLFAVADWICDVNPSLISQAEILDSIYQKRMAGRYFNLSFLFELVLQLRVTNTSVEYELYRELLFLIEEALGNESEDEKYQNLIVAKIGAMCHLRYKCISGSAHDYFRMQEEINHPWFQLVQYLAGAGWIAKNYYRLLITSLKEEYDYDAVSEELVTEYPLSDQILSTNNKMLINLRWCMAHYLANGTFFNCNVSPPIPLSDIEKKRIVFAAPDIYQFFLSVQEKFDDPALSRQTIEEVRMFVNAALNPLGLTNPEVSGDEYMAAAMGHYRLKKIYLKEHPEEKDILYRQRVKLGIHHVTVRELFNRIHVGDCIAVQSKYFAQLVADYDCVTKFHYQIEAEVNIENMRAASAKKVYSEYNALSEQEATKRILKLAVSLMTHKFFYAWGLGWVWRLSTVKLGAYNNYVTGSGLEMFKLFSRAIESGDFKHARFIYVQIIEHLVPNAIPNRSVMRSDDTQNWLIEIQQNVLFKKENQTSFDPELLFVVLWNFAQKNRANRNLTILHEQFLDKMLKLLIKPLNSYKKWVYINIEFLGFLNHVDMTENIRNELLGELRAKEGIVDSVALFNQATKQYFIFRLALIGALYCDRGINGFFGVMPNTFKQKYEAIQNKLDAELVVVPAPDKGSVEIINETILALHVILKQNDGERMRAYLHEIAPNIKVINEPVVIQAHGISMAAV